MLVPSAFMQSMSAFVAQNMGAEKPERAGKALIFFSCKRDYGVFYLFPRRSAGRNICKGQRGNTCGCGLSQSLRLGLSAHIIFILFYRIFQRLRQHHIRYASRNYRSIRRKASRIVAYEQTRRSFAVLYRSCNACFFSCTDHFVWYLFSDTSAKAKVG